MKKILFLPLLFLALSLYAKTERIPSYKSFVYWIQGNDSVYEENNTLLQESYSPDGTIIVRVRHEDWRSTVTEKSLMRLAPWHRIVSLKRGIRAILHQGGANTDAMMPMKMIPGVMPNALHINNLSSETEKYEMNYATEYMVENNSDQEVVVNDLNRGLVWYIPAHNYLLLNMGKLPQACLLRISNTDPLHPSVKYAIVASACYTVKYTVAYEDDDCWIFLIDEETKDNEEYIDMGKALGKSHNVIKTHYVRRDKDSFIDIPMLKEEVFDIIKKSKE
ncbi:MAG: hypothetical protein IKU79_01145 [Bacteroidaceae bacterium]|nr:hypothetical protein [Bacteroidaceae bacterium]